MRISAFSARRWPRCEPLRESVLRGGDLCHRGLWGLQAGEYAFPAVHGDHDLRGADRPADPVRAARVYLDGAPEARRQLLRSSCSDRETRGGLLDDSARGHGDGLSE